jgi:hypothetical protein
MNDQDNKKPAESRIVDVTKPGTGFTIFGDLTKGGRRATAEELQRLNGRQANGLPKGLTECPICRDWNGECLDRGENWKGLVMRLYCKCYAERCKKCGDIISSRKLNSNSYENGEIWHTPWFCGIQHKCVSSTTNERAERDG